MIMFILGHLLHFVIARLDYFLAGSFLATVGGVAIGEQYLLELLGARLVPRCATAGH